MRIKSNQTVKMLITGIMCLLSAAICCAQQIALPSLYVGTNRASLDSRYEVLDPGWGGQLGFNLKIGGKWIQFDGGLEFDVKGFRKKYDQTISSESGRNIESNNSITSYGLHTVLPLGLSLGYYVPDDLEGGNILGASVVGGGFIDLGIWGETSLTQKNRLSHNNNVLFEESNTYKQNCFGSHSLQRKRFDAGIYFGLAATTNIVGISVIYRKGLLNVSNIDNLSYKNNGLYINLTLNLTQYD